MGEALNSDFKKEYLLETTLLYIESDDNIRNNTYDIFSCVFKEVIVAKNGKEALSLYTKYKSRIDVILTDIKFDDISGLDLVSAIRTDNWNIPLLITTIFDDSSMILKLIKYNITNYIVKPMQMRTTFKIISQLIEEEMLKKDLKRQTYELEQFMSILDSINLVCEIGLDGKITYANDNFLMASGYTLNELLQKQHSRFSLEYDNDGTKQNVFDLVKTGEVWSGDCKKVKKDGTSYHTYSIILPILDNFGLIKKYVEFATSTTKYKSEIMQLKKQIVSIKSSSLKSVVEQKNTINAHNDLTQRYQKRVDDSVNNEQQLIMELYETKKQVSKLEEKLKKQEVRFEDFQSFHYQKIKEVVDRHATSD